MRANIRCFWLLLGSLMLAGCSTRQFTATVYQDPTWTVRLQKIPAANQGRGYDHPADLEGALLEKVLAGLQVRTGSDDPEKAYAPVFTEFERRHLAGLLARGLREAGQFEVVTFVQTIPATSWQERVTSGGVFLEGDRLHVILANLRVKQAVWQDTEQYEAPIETTPLEPDQKLPSGLTFQPADAVADPGAAAADFSKTFGLSPWHIAVRYPAL